MTSLGLAWRSLTRQPARALLGVVGIAAVGALLFDMLLLSRGLVVSFQDLLFAVKEVMQRAEMFAHHHVEREPLSVRERMSVLVEHLNPDQFVEFTSLFNVEEGRQGVVVTLLAILELIKESLIDMVQNEPFGPIHVKARI